MQIDFVITELYPGGAERCLCELAIGLKRRHHHVRIFSLQSLPQGPKRLLVDRLDDSSVQIATADANRIWDIPKAVAQLNEFWSGHKVDVVQTFLHHANVLGSVMARRHTIGKVVGGVRVAQPRRLRSRIERLATNRMDAVVCVSQSVATFAQAHLGVTDDQLETIGNGVNVGRFQSAAAYDWSQLKWPTDAVVILFAGRMDPQKNLDAIFSAAPHWLDGHPNRRLLMVGDGSEASRVETFCDSIADGRARYLSWLPDIAPALCSSRVVILPSHYEGMPNVSLEAMAAAKPVVCSAVEGSCELFPKGDSLRRENQVFQAGDQEMFQRLVSQYCEDQPLASEIGLANRRHVEKFHSIDQMVNQYEALYRKLCSDETKPS